MNFSEILNLFRQGKAGAKSHMKNLIEMAAVDGHFDKVEYELLKTIAKRNGISEGQLKSIQQASGEVVFELPKDANERFHQFYDLVHMMTIDNEVHQEEIKLCNLFAIKFGYPKDKADSLIESIQGNIQHGHDHAETMVRVSLMLT
ncbi:MAG: TerB family tellurite resistance protein [Cyclobacteriaceae bacterium]|nr:TerB family tellurite resistance protein [Cyclobacteriaceae bacterium]MCB9237121.1 TerB family tellurite resistance protein [Flammeovirgaceae bacterium]MCB0500151.1 TerB family tellurite resistance protein [Cyclobacteriaceae bacterium]MCO5270830.1 TerB family tellurite resistance protein [Cyclobacteriaceae bacterium]MCW5901884.1 TerB family tellurite resistance protein [Cyclobacteriaceae bacterium]